MAWCLVKPRDNLPNNDKQTNSLSKYGVSSEYDNGKMMKLSICLVKYYALKTWESGGIAPQILKIGIGWSFRP
jgi:hypothetical protein